MLTMQHKGQFLFRVELNKQQGTRIYKNIILYLYFSTMTLVWCRRAVGESLHPQRSCCESEQQAGTDFSQISRPYIILKFPCDPHGHVSSPMQCLFFVGHGIHTSNTYSPLLTPTHFYHLVTRPRIACFPLLTIYAHAIFITWVSRPCISVFPVVT